MSRVVLVLSKDSSKKRLLAKKVPGEESSRVSSPVRPALPCVAAACLSAQRGWSWGRLPGPLQRCRSGNAAGAPALSMFRGHTRDAFGRHYCSPLRRLEFVFLLK